MSDVDLEPAPPADLDERPSDAPVASEPAGPPPARPFARIVGIVDPLVCAWISVVVLLAYLPVLVSTYGISDDYLDLVKSTSDNSSLPDVAIAGGRPVSGLVQELALSLATDVSSLRWLRLVGLLGVIATALVAATIARTLGVGRLSQVGVGLMVAAMPSSQVIASWAVLFPVSWGAALALGAGFSVRALRPDRWISRQNLAVAAAIAVATVLGLSNYQPSAMAFAPGLVLALDDTAVSMLVRARRAAVAVAGAAVGGVVYLVTSRALIRARGLEADFRSSLQAPDADKLEWFVKNPLARSLDPWSFQPREWVALCVVGIIVVGCAVRPGTALDRVIRVGLALAALVVSYLPTLMIDDRWPSARSRLATDLTVALLGTLSVVWIIDALRRALGRRWKVLDLTVLSVAALSLVFASWRVMTYYVVPQALEYRLVSTAVRDLQIEPGSSLVIVAATWQEALAPVVDLDEFGFPSMANAWGPLGLVQIELIDDHRPLPGSIVVIAPTDPVPVGADVVLDIHRIYAEVR